MLAVVVASVVWTVSGGGSDAGKATLVPAANPTAPGDTSGATKLAKSFSAQGGTFRYPSSWHVATYNDVTSFSFSIAYLGTGPLHDPCTHGEGNLSCGPKNLGRLSPSGILVSWDIHGFPGVSIDNEPGSPTTIDGSPARIQVKPAVAGTQCAVIGAVTEVDVAVATTSQHGAGDFAG